MPLHDTGEEWTQKVRYRQDLIGSRDTQIEVGLYDDSTDSLLDASDVGDITTEPTDGNYARQKPQLDSTDIGLSYTNGNVVADLSVTFDLTNTTGSADSIFVVINFQSDVVKSETSQNDHLLFTAQLGTGSIDLSAESSYTVDLTDTAI